MPSAEDDFGDPSDPESERFLSGGAACAIALVHAREVAAAVQ